MKVQTIQRRQTNRNVAAYARVSTQAESQEESYATQVQYYTDLITQRPGWNFIKVYADRGITGTSAEKRPGFMSIGQIKDELKEKGAKTLRKKEDFEYSQISDILKNEVYVGDRLFGKTPARNYLTKKPDPSIQREERYVKDHHAPIISRELWDKVQEKLKIDAEERKEGTKARRDSHPYFNRIICGSCAEPYRRSFYCMKKTKERIPVWKCRNRIKGTCWARIVPESEIAPILEKAEKVKVTEFAIKCYSICTFLRVHE